MTFVFLVAILTPAGCLDGYQEYKTVLVTQFL